jgi:arsenate reductase
MKKKVLFICTENSCRSQMAEGILRYFKGDEYEVFSAGTNPSVVDPRAIKVMAEIGIDISGHKSKSVQEFLDKDFDFVITVCDKAKEACPVFYRGDKHVHWSFIDPKEARGSEKEVLQIFRRVRDEIKLRIQEEFGK